MRNNEIKTTQFIDLQLYYFMFNPTSTYAKCVSRCVSNFIMLTISVEVICYKVRPLRDNTYPLMLRLTQHRKRKYISLGVSVLEKDCVLRIKRVDL